MPAYFVVQGKVTDKDRYKQYQAAVQPLMAQFGGKLLVHGAKLAVLEGRHDGGRFLVFEFPSMRSIRAFWDSPEYAQIKALRQGAAQLDVWAIPEDDSTAHP